MDASVTILTGLGGVIVGAIASGAVAHLRDWRRERKVANAAVRVLREDLLTGLARLETSIEHELWWARPTWELPVERWERYRDALATTLHLEDWNRMASAFVAMEDVNLLVLSLENSPGGLTWEPAAKSRLQDAARDVRAALEMTKRVVT